MLQSLKYFGFLTVLLAGVGCSTSNQPITPYAEPERIDDHYYRLTYPLAAMQYRGTLPNLVNRAAKLTLAAGYEKFMFYHDQDVGSVFVIMVYMYNADQEVPWELMSFEEFDAKEYSTKKYIPLGRHPGAA